MDWFIEYWNCLGGAAKALLVLLPPATLFFTGACGLERWDYGKQIPWWTYPGLLTIALTVISLALVVLYWLGLALYQIVSCLF